MAASYPLLNLWLREKNPAATGSPRLCWRSNSRMVKPCCACDAYLQTTLAHSHSSLAVPKQGQPALDRGYRARTLYSGWEKKNLAATGSPRPC